MLTSFFFLTGGPNLPSQEIYAQEAHRLFERLEEAEQFVGNHPSLSKHLLKAKEEYIAITGLMNEGDEGYIQRVKAFLYWFLFDWEIPPQLTETPIKIFERHLDPRLKDNPFKLGNQVHSLFMFEKRLKGGVRLRDLYTKKRFFLANLEIFDGFEPGFWFETRLFLHEDYTLMADFLILHPKNVLKIVLPHIKLYQNKPKAFNGFLLQLQNYYNKWKNYKKIDVFSIYSLKKPAKTL